MKDFLARFWTPEGVGAFIGALWFLISSVFPVIPSEMPVPSLIPGLSAITPGLLCLGAVGAALIRQVVPGKTAFVNKVPDPEVKDA